MDTSDSALRCDGGFLGVSCIRIAASSQGGQDGQTVAACVWAALIVAPFAFYLLKHAQADRREVARTAEVANFERHPLPRSYPQVLEIYGYLSTRPLLMLADTLEIDEIAMFQSRAHRGRLRGSFIKLAPACRGVGKALLKRWRRGKNIGYSTKADKQCLIVRSETVAFSERPEAAIELRMGGQSTLKMSGTLWGGGNLEIRLRTAKGSLLLDYWERPHITRPSGPGPWGYANPDNTDRRTYPSPGALRFLTQTMGLVQPELFTTAMPCIENGGATPKGFVARIMRWKTLHCSALFLC